MERPKIIFLGSEFEVNISVVFEDNDVVSENFPVYIKRFESE
jgi:hypothetical protein